MEPFKNVFNRKVIATLGRLLAREIPRFSLKKWNADACADLESLEMKQRWLQVTHALARHLPSDFPEAAAVIRRLLHPNCECDPLREGTTADGVQSWMIAPLADYAGIYGKNHLPVAMELLRELTMRFTSEFGVRHLLLHDAPACLQIMHGWLDDPNDHVRRWLTEGTRPRLPWGAQIPGFIADPTATQKILHALRDDPSEYVRRSVANHLNDIARDHPQLALQIAEKWMKNAPAPRKKLLRHAMRNLLKKGEPQALALHGLAAPQLGDVSFTLASSSVPFYGDLSCLLEMTSLATVEQRLRLDIIVHYQKANGSLSPKTFLWKEIGLPAGQVHRAERRQSFRKITTRLYHPGLHRVELAINGCVMAQREFTLLPHNA